MSAPIQPDALDAERVRQALRRAPEVIAHRDHPRRASVSAILRAAGGGLEVMLIRRAQRAGDPWSGHMAFPGGRRDANDRDPQATAVRETREEVGIDLGESGDLLGQLDEMAPVSSSGLVVSPFVWWLAETPPLIPNGIEVDEIHWAPIGPLMRGERNTLYPYVHQGQALSFPGYRVGPPDAERVVWGMTHRMLESLFERVRTVL